jgi:hypothetical protein
MTDFHCVFVYHQGWRCKGSKATTHLQSQNAWWASAPTAISMPVGKL